jgi:hypothetical protein
MSSSAALAGAKKRRNVGFQSDNSKTEQTLPKNNISIPQKPTTMIEVVKKHDLKLFSLERKFEKFEENLTKLEKMPNKKDLDLPINSTSKLDNNINNKVETNTNEIINLKATVNNLTKKLNETNSLVTTLRASLIAQTTTLNSLNQLKLEFNNYVEKNKIEKVTEVKAEVKDEVIDEVKDEVIDEVKDEVKAELNAKVESLEVEMPIKLEITENEDNKEKEKEKE